MKRNDSREGILRLRKETPSRLSEGEVGKIQAHSALEERRETHALNMGCDKKSQSMRMRGQKDGFNDASLILATHAIRSPERIRTGKRWEGAGRRGEADGIKSMTLRSCYLDAGVGRSRQVAWSLHSRRLIDHPRLSGLCRGHETNFGSELWQWHCVCGCAEGLRTTCRSCCLCFGAQFRRVPGWIALKAVLAGAAC